MPVAKAQNSQTGRQHRFRGHRRAQRTRIESRRAGDENAVVVVLHLDPEQAGKAASQGRRHRGRLVEGIGHQQSTPGQQPRGQIEPRMRQPIGFADLVPSAHENVVHHQVEGARLRAEHRPGILDAHFDIQGIEVEMRPGQAHHLGVEFHPHNTGLGRQGAHDSGSAPPAQAEQQDPATASRRQGQ